MHAPRKNRSRGACATCRRRKRKCDETRPACLVCQKGQIPCEGYPLKLTWNCGVASRGRLAGSAVPVRGDGNKIALAQTKASTSLSGFEQQTTPPSDIVEGPGCEVDLPPLLLWTPGVAEPLSEESPDADRGLGPALFDDEESRMISQFLESKIHLLHATSTDDAMIQNFREASKESAALMAVCLALQLYGEPDQVERFHLCFERALGIFKQELEACGGALKRGTLCAGLLLCTASVIGVMDLPFFVFGRRTAPLGFWRRLRKAQSRWRGGKTTGGVEMISGLPRSLLDILARADEPSVEMELWNWCGEIGEYLQAQLWEAWRYAAILFVRKYAGREDDKKVDHDRDRDSGGEARPLQCPASHEYLLWRLISNLHTLMLGLQQPEARTFLFGNAAFWPYLVARCEFSLLMDHPEWEATLSHLWVYINDSDEAAHVRIANSMIKEAWERGDETCNLHEIALARGIELGAF
ncbi:hypothetical protein ACJ41O_005556 [Fusarium nematophilum]